jgi:hypothetical protein
MRVHVVEGRWAPGLEALRGASPGDEVLLFVSWARVEPRRGRYDDVVFQELRDGLVLAGTRSLRRRVVLHSGAMPGWLRDHGGWEAPDALAAWGCYVEAVGAGLRGQVDGWVSLWEPSLDAMAHGPAWRRAGRVLLDAAAVAYLHLRRGSAARAGVDVLVAESFGGDAASPREALAGRLADATRERFVEVLRTGRLGLPWAVGGELPNGTPALDGLLALGTPAAATTARWRTRGLAFTLVHDRSAR